MMHLIGGTASMAYNERGLPTTRTDTSGTATFTWQPARDQLATITDTAGGTRGYAGNSFGQLAAESYGTALRTYGYDNAGRLASDTTTNAGGATLAGFAYTYDASSNVASKTVNLPGNTQSGMHTYDYDLAERLTTWTSNSVVTPYQYDPAGNRTLAGTGTYTYDDRNRLQTGPGETYTYSARGALRQSTKNGVVTTFTVDATGRTAQSAVTGQAAINYVYDGLDRVLNRNGTPFTYTGTAMDPTSDGTTTFSRSPDGTPLWLTKAGATIAAGVDRHGDLAFTLNANLTVGSTSVYDPFGVPAGKTGPGTAIGFQSDWTEPTTGNVWMGARWYTPGNASFTTRDTYAGNPASPVTLNRYTYGVNNPIMFWDPTGHWACGDDYCDDSQLLTGDGTPSNSEPAASQTLTNTELWAQYQATGHIPNDNPIDTSTSITTTPDGTVTVWNPSSGVGGILTNGSSVQVGGGAITSSSAANTPPIEIDGKRYNAEDSFSYAAAGGVQVNCTAAATAAGYGRTCTAAGADGRYGVVAAAGFNMVDANGTTQTSGVIDRNNYNDFSQGTINVYRAAFALANGADYEDTAKKYDSPAVTAAAACGPAVLVCAGVAVIGTGVIVIGPKKITKAVASTVVDVVKLPGRIWTWSNQDSNTITKAKAIATAVNAAKHKPAIVVAAGGRAADLPAKGKPNSTGVKDDGAGSGQIRDYGADGRATTDFDFGHDHGVGDPHVHDWNWNLIPPRQPGRSLKPGEGTLK